MTRTWTSTDLDLGLRLGLALGIGDWGQVTIFIAFSKYWSRRASSSFSFSSSPPLLFTHFGESPVRENLFPEIFCHN